LAILGCSWTSPDQASAQILPPLPGDLIVTITSPSSGATVSGTITVSASISPVGALVGGVQFKLDGANLGAEDTSAPYSVSWNTTTKSNGSHTLTAVARDALGLLYTSSPVTVTVSNAPPPDTTPPTVSITSPGNGATVSGITTVSASASDNVGVVGVQFFADGSAQGSEDTSSPYSISWNTTAASNGSHTLTARARDAAGNTATSAAVTVTVSNTPPPGTTRFEESAATLTPAGAWSAIDSAGAGATLSGDRGVFTSTASARASFAFSGTGVRWIALPCEVCGIARIFMDDTLSATVDTFAPSRPSASTVLFGASGLPAASHTLVVEVTGTQNPSSDGASILVDAFDVEGSTSGGGGSVTRIEETNTSVRYAGSWINISDPGVSGGTAVEAFDPNASASLTFNGTAVSWIGARGPWAGIAQVFLDGTLKATVDTYAPANQLQAVMYTASGLASGSHTLVIDVTGTNNPSAASAWVVVDGFDVTSGTGPSPDTRPPTAAITSPAGGATVSGTVSVSATASDDVGVAGVQFLADGSAIGPEDTAAPYSVAWDTTRVANGSHTLTAVARDGSGNTGTSTPVTVSVANGAPAATRFEESSATLEPAASWFGLTSAQAGVTLSGDFADFASDAGATATFGFTGTGVSWIGFKCEQCGIARVSLDGTVVATVDTYAPSRPAASGVIFSSATLPAGGHTLVIEVTGASNASSAGGFIAVDAFDVR
jgi:hypothetical protein